MKRWYLVFFLIPWLFLTAGCAHREPQPETGLKPEAFWKDQQARSKSVDQVAAKLRLTFFGKNRSISGRGQLVRQPKRRVRLELRDPLGRVHYLAAQDQSAFTAHYPRRRLAYTDNKGGNRYVRAFLGLDFTFLGLQDIFVGLLPDVQSKTVEGWKWDGETGEYVGTVQLTDRKATIRVDGRGGELTGLSVPMKEGTIEVKYSHFEPCCRGVGGKSNIRVAGIVELKLSQGLSGMEVEWERIRAMEKPRPANVYRVQLDKKDRRIDLENLPREN